MVYFESQMKKQVTVVDKKLQNIRKKLEIKTQQLTDNEQKNFELSSLGISSQPPVSDKISELRQIYQKTELRDYYEGSPLIEEYNISSPIPNSSVFQRIYSKESSPCSPIKDVNILQKVRAINNSDISNFENAMNSSTIILYEPIICKTQNLQKGSKKEILLGLLNKKKDKMPLKSRQNSHRNSSIEEKKPIWVINKSVGTTVTNYKSEQGWKLNKFSVGDPYKLQRLLEQKEQIVQRKSSKEMIDSQDIAHETNNQRVNYGFKSSFRTKGDKKKNKYEKQEQFENLNLYKQEQTKNQQSLKIAEPELEQAQFDVLSPQSMMIAQKEDFNTAILGRSFNIEDSRQGESQKLKTQLAASPDQELTMQMTHDKVEKTEVSQISQNKQASQSFLNSLSKQQMHYVKVLNKDKDQQVTFGEGESKKITNNQKNNQYVDSSSSNQNQNKKVSDEITVSDNRQKQDSAISPISAEDQSSNSKIIFQKSQIIQNVYQKPIKASERSERQCSSGGHNNKQWYYEFNRNDSVNDYVSNHHPKKLVDEKNLGPRNGAIQSQLLKSVKQDQSLMKSDQLRNSLTSSTHKANAQTDGQGLQIQVLECSNRNIACGMSPKHQLDKRDEPSLMSYGNKEIESKVIFEQNSQLKMASNRQQWAHEGLSQCFFDGNENFKVEDLPEFQSLIEQSNYMRNLADDLKKPIHKKPPQYLQKEDIGIKYKFANKTPKENYTALKDGSQFTGKRNDNLNIKVLANYARKSRFCEGLKPRGIVIQDDFLNQEQYYEMMQDKTPVGQNEKNEEVDQNLHIKIQLRDYEVRSDIDNIPETHCVISPHFIEIQQALNTDMSKLQEFVNGNNNIRQSSFTNTNSRSPKSNNLKFVEFDPIKSNQKKRNRDNSNTGSVGSFSNVSPLIIGEPRIPYGFNELVQDNLPERDPRAVTEMRDIKQGLKLSSPEKRFNISMNGNIIEEQGFNDQRGRISAQQNQKKPAFGRRNQFELPTSVKEELKQKQGRNNFGLVGRNTQIIIKSEERQFIQPSFQNKQFKEVAKQERKLCSRMQKTQVIKKSQKVGVDLFSDRTKTTLTTVNKDTKEVFQTMHRSPQNKD